MEIKNVTVLPGEKQVGLFISGNAAGKNVLYICEDLEYQDKMERCLFSVYDNHEDDESKDIEEGYGFPLQRYLDQAEVFDAEEIRLGSVDGFESIVTELGSKRYYFPELVSGKATGREPREAFISFFKNGIPVKYYPHPTIMFGQQGVEDRNKDYFAKGIRMLVAGNAERGFWVRGEGVRCNRYFSLSRFFEWNSRQAGTMYWMELEFADGSSRRVPAIQLPMEFWKEQAECAPEYLKYLQVVDHEGDVIGKVTDTIWLFLADEAYKQIGYYDGQNIILDFAGVLAGKEKVVISDKEIKIPQIKDDDSEFYIRITRQGEEQNTYYYSLQELHDLYEDSVTEEEYCYYNHNMNKGQGGLRKVTGHGWLLLSLLEYLPEIPSREELENGSVTFQIFTSDNYKEKITLGADELSAYRFMLTYEQDQRSSGQIENGDTSAWTDENLHFITIHGTTPFRIYCGKESANPSVYKNVVGMVVEILA